MNKIASHFVNDNFYTGKSGVWYFIPHRYKNYKKGHAAYGFGAVRYDEGSVYTGNLYFDGKDYHKIGLGRQDFANSFLGNLPDSNERILCYIGQYDYRKNDWIYGNGVLYFVSPEGKPTRFVKGFFDGLNRVEKYQGEFDPSLLLEGYSLDMESDDTPRDALFRKEREAYVASSTLEALFIGDSYFEFWHYKDFAGNSTFSSVYPKEAYLNLGLGGTTYKDWFFYFPQVELDKAPKRVIISLGVNDTHSWLSRNEIIANYKECLKLIRQKYPQTKIYVLTVADSPAFAKQSKKVALYNRLLKEEAKKDQVEIVDLAEALKQKKEKLGTYFFAEDGLHLNEKGYQELIHLLKEVLL